MKITNVKVYDLEESIIASGLPMMADYDERWIENEKQNLAESEDITDNPHFKRTAKLADTPIGSGHANALSGILVSMNITATVKWWEQFQRYHFKQIVSSMSTMHRLRKMLREGTAEFNSNTDPDIVKKITFLAMENEEVVTDEQLAYSCPMGLELTARITTNYLALKTIKNQRKNHKLAEWRQFCEWIDSLPYAKELIG
jgi:hypothetical protein